MSDAYEWLKKWEYRANYSLPHPPVPRWRFPDGSILIIGSDIGGGKVLTWADAGPFADAVILDRAKSRARWRAMRVAWQKLERKWTNLCGTPGR